MNWTELVTECDWWAGTNATTYPLADKARNANKALRQIGRRIIRSMYAEGYLDNNSTTFNIETTDLVAGEDNVALEVGMFTVERVRVKDRNGNWKTIASVARRELTDEDLSRTGVPEKFCRIGQSLLLSPIPNYSVFNGVEIEYQASLAQPFTPTGNDDRTPGFDEDYHPLVGMMMARDYAAKHDRNRYEAVSIEIQRIEADMDKDFQRRNRTKQPRMTFKRNTSHIIL